MIFHDYRNSCSTFIKYSTKVNLRRSKCYCINSKDALNIKFNWQDLVCSCNLYWHVHCKFFIFIFGRDTIILLYQIFLAVSENCSIRFELKPNFKCSFALNVTQGRIKFQIWLQTSWEKKLNFHWLIASIIQNDLFSIELFIYQNIHIVLLFFYMDRYIYTFAFDRYSDGISIILIF